MTNHWVWLIYTIHPYVWLFLNTAIVFLIDFKNDIYSDSLSPNRAMFFIPRTCKWCHCIAQLEQKTKQINWHERKYSFKWPATRELTTWVNVNWLTTSNLVIIKMLEKMLTVLFKWANYREYYSQDKEAVTVEEDKPF